MLDCKLCNYYHAVSGKSFPGLNLGICDFSDTLFIEDVENLNIEYPCRKISYNDYLRKKSMACITPFSVASFVNPELFRELQDCGVSMLKFPEGIIEKCFKNHLEQKNHEVRCEAHTE
ncbi:hypothetical protein FL966_05035 [Caproiciproducens galactitolivorans]|uniref:Uncharacterized protein n=1 Tax=Caproiciproducens galactitolivorans TaxID=642589 RepID=A0A4Z0YJE2_9FIRM|nr:hypothetical protein [Caproiciproducens galactitolivorans]QEY34465.1 hypothetical protein FL966_05035 [Caproiciproducens galactitolivorans]TGJ77756.1 hypothetical protein CAGA_01540 [Caproiciproducens galactitolivorans]